MRISKCWVSGYTINEHCGERPTAAQTCSIHSAKCNLGEAEVGFTTCENTTGI